VGLVALAVIGDAARTVDAGAAAGPQPHGFSVVGNGAIVLAKIQRRTCADKMGDRESGIETNRLFSISHGAIGFMAHGPEIGAVGIGLGVVRIDFDCRVEICFRLGEAALECARVAPLGVGGGKLATAHGTGIDHGGAADDGIVRRGDGLTARAPCLICQCLCI